MACCNHDNLLEYVEIKGIDTHIVRSMCLDCAHEWVTVVSDKEIDKHFERKWRAALRLSRYQERRRAG